MLSFAEENYLKTIYHLAEDGEPVSTNAIADAHQTRAASVSDMIKKLAAKKLISYRKYYGVKMTPSGRKSALQVIRKHRLWEVFLVNKLGFNWDEVHEVAEQLEHVKSRTLTNRLDQFLGYPKFDPHGDPIPNEEGEFVPKPQIRLMDASIGQMGILVSVIDSSTPFLKYLDKIGAHIGVAIKVLDRAEYDGSLEILINNREKVFISKEVSENLMIEE